MQSSTNFNLETIVLQLTTSCPYNCPQCYMQRGNRDMSIDVAKSIITYALSLGAGAIQLTGGEPLIYPNIFDIIKYSSELGLKSLLATSGYNCSDETYSRLKSCGLTAICVSINGISEEANKKSRTPFAEAINAIQTAQLHNIICFVNIVVTDDNVNELELLGEYVKRYGVVGVNILHPIPSHDGHYIPTLSLDTIKQIAEVDQKHPDFFFVERCHKEYWEYVTKNKFTCRDIGKTTYFVTVDGMISPCSKMMKYKYNSLLDMLTQYKDWECGCL